MRAALVGNDLAWLQQRELAGQHTQLNDVISKVASAGKWDDRRLRQRDIDGAVALAANVPLSGEDVARATGTVPTSTLRTLPRALIPSCSPIPMIP